jgi:hypothetical protein
MNAHEGTIAALLGPREAEVDCDVCFALLDQYVEQIVDGADPRAANPEMHAHLRGCPACHEEFESLHALVATAPDQGIS